MPRPQIKAKEPPAKKIIDAGTAYWPRKAEPMNGHNGSGRPTQYQPNYAEVAFQLALLGATMDEIAAALMVHPNTLRLWMAKTPTFRERLEQGRVLADAKVAHCLYQRATGYDYEAEELFYDRTEGTVVRAPVVKHVPPDVSAQKHWLGARRREQWMERSATEVTGANGAPLQAPIIHIHPVKVLAKE